ncbi:MAG: hypothetical protein H6708_05225 [Kofleriaceae bacterium]|nr:hypothetical protein [Kofleriaceae bacterium]
MPPAAAPLPRVDARHVRAAYRRGSSWPVRVDTDAGAYVVKLRGAAQGVAALTAEIVVAELAEAIGLDVPARALVRLDGDVATDDRHEELRHLLAASAGWNLGLRHLDGATDVTAADLATIDADRASRIAWLDGLAMNVDRTAANPNLLRWRDRLWLIDHGAALPFAHDWAHVTEAHPRRPWPLDRHALAARATRLRALDAELAARLDRDVVAAAIARVPDELLAPSGGLTEPARLRAAYHAFLWKRLRAPRPWLPPG